MRILLIGSGGREHALAWKIAASTLCEKLFCAPGNAGIAEVAELVPIAADDLDGLAAFAREAKIDLAVIGPEAPLAAGIVDQLEAAGIPAFGPTAAAARLEGSKVFMKEVCRAAGIPTAASQVFSDAAAAKAYVRAQKLPIVVKADGLAAGKGVTVAAGLQEADAAIEAALVLGSLGAAGKMLVIEEFLTGEEVSFFALCDGNSALPLASAQDHKTAYDGDRGPNTGGMGAYSPAPIMTKALELQVMQRIVEPTLAHMAKLGTPFKGILFAGLMLTDAGPKLLEFNVRFGDPETEVLMLRLRSDLVPALFAARDGVLKNFDLRWSETTALCVVMAARGYPGKYGSGSTIRGVERAAAIEGVQIFHAGTRQKDGVLQAAGGRVLAIAASGFDVTQAQTRAYDAVDQIDWPEGFCRRDIGWRARAREKRSGVA
jgi:phosphoribosylamine---glycine ligase